MEASTETYNGIRKEIEAIDARTKELSDALEELHAVAAEVGVGTAHCWARCCFASGRTGGGWGGYVLDVFAMVVCGMGVGRFLCYGRTISLTLLLFDGER